MTRGVLVLALLSAPVALAAQQEDSLFTLAVRLTTEGQGDSARALVRSRLRALAPGDSLYPQVLYTAGVVATRADSAGHYFRRVSIEYSGSPWADSALLRLGQIGYASGDFVGALRATVRIVMDYPGSPLLAEAGYWAARAQFELDSVPQGCELLARAAETAGEDVELANRIRFYRQRCVVAVATDTQARPPPDTGVRPARTAYAVQVAAVRSPTAADEVMRRLASRGYEPHVVRDADGLLKVRVGRYARREEAQRLVAELKRVIGGDPFVVEES